MKFQLMAPPAIRLCLEIEASWRSGSQLFQSPPPLPPPYHHHPIFTGAEPSEMKGPKQQTWLGKQRKSTGVPVLPDIDIHHVFVWFDTDDEELWLLLLYHLGMVTM